MKRKGTTAAAVATLVALAGCGGAADDGTGGLDKQGELSGSLVVWGFGGTFDEALQSTVVKPFMDKHPGVKVTLAPPANTAAHITKLLANKGNQDVDIDVSGAGLWNTAIANGLYEQLDPANVPNLDQLYDVAKGPEGYGPSVAATAVGIAYNTKKVTSPVTSWKDLLDQRYRGHVGLPNLDNTAGLMVLVELAKMNGGSEQDIDPGFRQAEQLRAAQQPTFFTTSVEERTAFANGSMWIAPMFDGQALLLKQAGQSVDFVYPAEGGYLTPTMVNIVKGTKVKRVAEEFINFWLDPQVQAAWAAASLYGPTNRTTQLPTDVAAKVIYGEQAFAKLVNPDWKVVNENRAEWNDRWQRDVLAK